MSICHTPYHCPKQHIKESETQENLQEAKSFICRAQEFTRGEYLQQFFEWIFTY
jgi:hypothetical protein